MASQKGLGLNPRAVKLRYLDRTAEEAGRQKRWGDVPGRLTPRNNVARNTTLDEVEDYEPKQDFGTYYPKRFIKSFSDRAQLDKLAAIYGLLKAFEGKTFDEFYSAFKTGCSQSSIASMHVAQHAMEKLYTSTEVVDGVIYGTNKRRWGPHMHQLKKDEYYVDQEGVICRVQNANIHPPKVYPERKGFWADVYVKVKNDPDFPSKKELKYRYIIGPFSSKHIKNAELKSFKLEQGFSNNIHWKPGLTKIESDVPIPGHYCVRDWKRTFWCPQYYIVLEEAKVQTNPYSLYRNRKPTLCSVGTVIYDHDIQYPI
jgi:hypothetical protein